MTRRFIDQNPRFPIRPDLPIDAYPDITEPLDDLKFDMFNMLGQSRAWKPDEEIVQELHRHFSPEGAWDVIDRKKPQFPGLDAFGHVEYGLYQNKPVSGNFLNHHLLGSAITALGHHPAVPGFSEIPRYGRPFPVKDMPSHLREASAIMSGYMNALGDKTWQKWDFPEDLYRDHPLSMTNQQGNKQSDSQKTTTEVPLLKGNVTTTEYTSNEIRRRVQASYIRRTYGLEKGRKLDWWDFAEVADFMAETTRNEEQFRQDMWYHFGTGRSNLLQYFDNTNPGLPYRYRNINERGEPIYYPSKNPKQPRNPGEQLHHYLGGVTGDTGKERNFPFNIPSHHLNAFGFSDWHPFSTESEKKEQDEYGWWNQGDINLFDLSRAHYQDFNRPGGRFTLGNNLRKSLLPRKKHDGK